MKVKRSTRIRKLSSKSKYGITGLLNCSLFAVGLSEKHKRILAQLPKVALATIISNSLDYR